MPKPNDYNIVYYTIIIYRVIHQARSPSFYSLMTKYLIFYLLETLFKWYKKFKNLKYGLKYILKPKNQILKDYIIEKGKWRAFLMNYSLYILYIGIYYVYVYVCVCVCVL